MEMYIQKKEGLKPIGGIKTTNRTDVTVPGLAAADAVQLNALVQGTVAYTAAQAGSTE